ncbi:MAG: hypothetical protein LBJ47_10385, partial [Tannerella sp.]|nr:hypothetical protein [Tannerella sp.]
PASDSQTGNFAQSVTRSVAGSSVRRLCLDCFVPRNDGTWIPTCEQLANRKFFGFRPASNSQTGNFSDSDLRATRRPHQSITGSPVRAASPRQRNVGAGRSPLLHLSLHRDGGNYAHNRTVQNKLGKVWKIRVWHTYNFVE